jgi:hypothetical protein
MKNYRWERGRGYIGAIYLSLFFSRLLYVHYTSIRPLRIRVKNLIWGGGLGGGRGGGNFGQPPHPLPPYPIPSLPYAFRVPNLINQCVSGKGQCGGRDPIKTNKYFPPLYFFTRYTVNPPLHHMCHTVFHMQHTSPAHLSCGVPKIR